MTATTAHEQETGSGEAGSHRRVVIAVVLALAVLGALWWWTHPGAFSGHGNAVRGQAEPGTPMYIGLDVVPADESIHLIDATPRILFNDTDAEVHVLVCRLADIHLAVGFGRDIAPICESVRSPDGRVDGLDQLIIEVTAPRSGVVIFEGIDVTYRTPYQWGTQTTGMTGTVIVDEP